jgi:protein gp37
MMQLAFKQRLGVSSERQQEANERIPELMATPAAMRLISAEPLLGPIDLNEVKFTLMPGFFGGALR